MQQLATMAPGGSLLMRASLVAVTCVGLATAAVAPPADAATRITVGGAGPLYMPNLITNLPVGRFYLNGTRAAQGPPVSVLEGYDLLNHLVGENWFPGTSAQVVNYPASVGVVSGSLAAPGANQAVAMGRVSLHDQIRNAASGGEPVVIAALSMGTLVINSELAYLSSDPAAPPPDRLSFALFGGPELGVAATYLPLGVTVPIIDYTVRDLSDSQYDVAVVYHQYDGWADPPDRPWNLVAVVNALFGTLYFHNNSSVAAVSDAVALSSSKTALGGTTTTYMIPSSTVPMLLPLAQAGVPEQVIAGLNAKLKPIVDAGYSDLTPDAGPYFSRGRLQFSPPVRAATTSAATTSAAASSAAKPRAAASAQRNSIRHAEQAGVGRPAPALRGTPR